MAGRKWTSAEDDAIRRGYKSVPAADIAAAFDRTPSAVHQRANRLGLTRTNKGYIDWTAAVDGEFRRLHSLGMTDSEIAVALGCERLTVAKRRRGNGMSSNRYSDRSRKRAGERFRRQLERMGLERPADLRAVSARNLAVRYGLPPDLKPRHVQIILLLVNGPRTKRQICESLGLATDEKRPSGKCLHSDDQHWTYLGGLIARGLAKIVRLPGPGGGRGRFRGPQNVYTLTPRAMDLLTAKKEGDRAAHAHA